MKDDCFLRAFEIGGRAKAAFGIRVARFFPAEKYV
jgi:hypothetical protein